MASGRSPPRLLLPAGKPLSQTERDAKELLDWLDNKGSQSFTRTKLGQYAPGALRKATDRRNAAIDELLRRCLLAEHNGEIRLVALPAVAFSAVSAGKNSVSNSKNSNSKPEEMSFSEAMTPPNFPAQRAADDVDWQDDFETATVEF